MTTATVRWLAALLLLGAVLAGIDLSAREPRAEDKLIAGPYASLLGASTDLGPAREQSIEFTASLTDRSRPTALIDWARDQSLSVRWRPGDDWVVVEG